MSIFRILALTNVLFFACQQGSKKVQQEIISPIKIRSPYADLKEVLDKNFSKKGTYEAYFIPPSFCTMCDTKSVSDRLFQEYKNEEKAEMTIFINPHTKEAIKNHLREASKKYDVVLNLRDLQDLSMIPLVQILKIEFTNDSVSRIINHETEKTVFP